jgi:hypothetical protein
VQHNLLTGNPGRSDFNPSQVDFNPGQDLARLLNPGQHVLDRCGGWRLLYQPRSVKIFERNVYYLAVTSDNFAAQQRI